ncbi:hypothetical protein [Xylella fastidiosa]|uniref:Uncharacterized protein n=2 Tax=Xylella fastidiosa TaxID=2371 RepID=A0ABD7BXN4_XYLFS|nr:hypothetical protein [Xylella fastidiosa]AAF83715.1 hypothetical protein XF_0905 [Xylella fastidiosa 9a5c]MDG5822565.1 hypothetical protein [Xylella fastidiosa subsp. pauca]MDG5826060.1 hypothetical protein [Xylella fastidiosa subsp. pauca]QPB72607.1 hypothetical protein XFHB_13925 [Xylella fastidiosa]QPB73251.1 hypothetical protein XFC3_13225 [Xylella fastidiosa]
MTANIPSDIFFIKHKNTYTPKNYSNDPALFPKPIHITCEEKTIVAKRSPTNIPKTKHHLSPHTS